MSVICVTGPMAAGKNTVSDMFARRGWCVIDADHVAHHALEAVTPAIIEAFDVEGLRRGIKIAPGGVIDRRALGRLLFASPAMLAQHEAIVLPEVEREILDMVHEAVEKATGGGTRLSSPKDVVLNAVSLYKTPRLMALCSLIVYVTAPVMVRFMRVRRRDGLAYTDIARRFYAQRELMSKYKKTRIPITIVKNY